MGHDGSFALPRRASFSAEKRGPVFRGVAQLNLDSKGRLAVPARHRDALLARCSGHLVLTADSDRCVLIYPLPDWEPIEQKLMALSSFNAQIRELQRRLVGYAEDVQMDATGRILVSPALRSYAHLEKNVVLVGQGNKFELWNEDTWEQLLERAGGFGAGGLPPELEGFSL